MYKSNAPLPASILIVKTSSLGDIIQAFYVLEHLHFLADGASIDWVVDPAFYSLVKAHPMVRRAVCCDIKKNFFEGVRALRKEKYDLLFDLQGNCKSGIISFLARAKMKVGYGFRSAREWPSAFASHLRFDVARNQNIRTFYLKLIESYFSKESKAFNEGVKFSISEEEKVKVRRVLSAALGLKIMVCPGSMWANKRLALETWILFLQKIEETKSATFFLVWGNLQEKAEVEQIAAKLKQRVVVERLEIPSWQNLMGEMDLVLAVDSGALHLCATTKSPSFSIFGSTQPEVFKPLGPAHFHIQGTCPYGKTFEKQCPVLRSCSTGACMKNISAEELFQAFQNQCGFLQL